MANIEKATALAADFRRLADFIEANPELADTYLGYAMQGFNLPVQTRDRVVGLARMGMRAGFAVTKHQNDNFAGVDITVGDSISLHVYARRDEVCERIVTGTREVTEEVPDPEALAAVPKVTVTRVEEDVEWRCLPLLAESADVFAEDVPAEAVTA